MEHWTDQELATIDLGDRRLDERAVQVVQVLAERPETSIPQAFSGWAEVKAVYRFLSSPRVSAGSLRDAHHESTASVPGSSVPRSRRTGVTVPGSPYRGQTFILRIAE